MKKIIPQLFLFALILSPFFQGLKVQAQNSDQKLYRIYVEDMSKIQNLEKTGVNIYNLEPQVFVEIIATKAQAERLEKEGFTVEFLASSFSELNEFSLLKSSSEYHDHQETVVRGIEMPRGLL